jgi:uncharacterized Zn-binding protein involved in type VI secretion
MSKPAAKKFDTMTATDMHYVDGVPVALPFEGVLLHQLSPDVLVEQQPVATRGSGAKNVPSHVPPPGKSFTAEPSNYGGILTCTGKNVLVNGLPIARDGDVASTCDDLGRNTGVVRADGTVLVGDG